MFLSIKSVPPINLLYWPTAFGTVTVNCLLSFADHRVALRSGSIQRWSVLLSFSCYLACICGMMSLPSSCLHVVHGIWTLLARTLIPSQSEVSGSNPDGAQTGSESPWSVVDRYTAWGQHSVNCDLQEWRALQIWLQMDARCMSIPSRTGRFWGSCVVDPRRE